MARVIDTDISGSGELALPGGTFPWYVSTKLVALGGMVRHPEDSDLDHVIGAGWWAIGFTGADAAHYYADLNYINFTYQFWQGKERFFASDSWNWLRYRLSPGTTGHITLDT